MNLPATINTSFEGNAQAFQASRQGMGVLLVLALFVIYLVLGILYENFIRRRRALVFAAADALHHTGDLPLLRARV